MVTISKKLNKISKLKISKTLHVIGQDFVVQAQVSVVPCHLDDATIPNIPYTLTIDHDDFVKVNGENVYYTREEIDNILSSHEVKNLIMKEIVKKALLS
jgi:predicted membrane protein